MSTLQNIKRTCRSRREHVITRTRMVFGGPFVLHMHACAGVCTAIPPWPATTAVQLAGEHLTRGASIGNIRYDRSLTGGIQARSCFSCRDACMCAPTCLQQHVSWAPAVIHSHTNLGCHSHLVIYVLKQLAVVTIMMYTCFG